MLDWPGRPLALEEAASWVHESLTQGSALAAAVGERLEQFSSAWLLVPEHADVRGGRLDQSCGLRIGEADVLARQLLTRLARTGHHTLVVEDELARKGDPHLDPDISFVGDRVVRWTEIDEHAEQATTLLRSGSSGYPLNAFVCRCSAPTLHLTTGSDLSAESRGNIIASTKAVIASVYDGEAFVVLLAPPELQAGQIVTGTVVEHRHFGVFIEIGQREPGIALVTAINDEPKQPSTFPQIGTPVEAVFLGFAGPNHQPRLSLRPADLAAAGERI
jgi:hypothetical protein